MSNIVLVIPARYESTRLPGKPLRIIAGKPMIQHVFERAQEASKALDFQRIVIATDDQRIEKTCVDFGATVCMTSKDHETGTDRLAEVVRINAWADDTIVVNLQGDEPLTPISSLKQVTDNLKKNSQASIATLATPLSNTNEYNDPNVVKVVTQKNGLALYFSRASIPFQRDIQDEEADAVFDFALRHIGIYAYRAGYLKSFTRMESCGIEQLEKLEQLRAIWNGARIHVAIAKDVPGHGVDTEEDLIAVEKILLEQDS